MLFLKIKCLISLLLAHFVQVGIVEGAAMAEEFATCERFESVSTVAPGLRAHANRDFLILSLLRTRRAIIDLNLSDTKIELHFTVFMLFDSHGRVGLKIKIAGLPSNYFIPH